MLTVLILVIVVLLLLFGIVEGEWEPFLIFVGMPTFLAGFNLLGLYFQSLGLP